MADLEDSERAVRLEHPRPHVALVTLDRPSKRNAVNGAIAAGLARAVRETEADDAIRVVVLTGAGPVFCAGADLNTVSAPGGGANSTPEFGFAGFVNAPRTKPWIAAANGAALAGGLEILLACDMAVAAENAFFGLPEVQRGLIAAAGGVFRLTRALPRGVALRMITTGERMDAKTAFSHGLLCGVTPPGGAVEAALALAATIAANAPLAVRESLAVARQSLDLTEPELWAEVRAARDRLAVTEDFQEGPRAFLEKRPAQWKGR